MTLRTEMRDALDQVVTTSPHGLSDRVLRTAVSDGTRRSSRQRWASRMRAPLALVAAFALIAIVAGVLVGGRLLRDWDGLHNPNAAGPRTLAQLETLPVTLPVVVAGEGCPDNPGVNSLGYDFGSGPVYVNGKLIPQMKFVSQAGSGGALYDLSYYSAPALTGLVLIRGRDLVENRTIRFISPTGSGFPSDTPPWPLKNELVLDAGHPPSRTAATGYGIWHIGQEIDDGWSGCWGFQIDGSNFSETITGFIRPY